MTHSNTSLRSSLARWRRGHIPRPRALLCWLLLALTAVGCADVPEVEDEEAQRRAAYESDLSENGYVSKLRAPPQPGDPAPGDPPLPDRARLWMGARTDSSIRLGTLLGLGRNELYRSVGTGVESRLAYLSGSNTHHLDERVQPGQRYCYRIKTTASGKSVWSNRVCGRTLYAPYRFSGLGISQSESDAIVRDFDWHKTEALYAGGSEPHLWYMNILVDAPDSIRVLRADGIHAQTTPLFPEERAAMPENATVPQEDGLDIGMWVYAVVPAPLYNDLRRQMIERADNGEEQMFRAAVFRPVFDSDARVWSSREYSPLSYRHLAEQGFTYEGEKTERCFETPDGRICEKRQEIFGWLGRKIFRFVGNLIEDVVDSVRGAFGRYRRLVKGEATLTLDLRVLNTDRAFGANEEVLSAWSGRPIELADTRVKVYQGFAGFYARTDDQGVARLKVAKGRSGRVCVELKNDRVEFLDTFTEREVCVGTVPSISGDSRHTVNVVDDYVNAYVQMTDAAERMKHLTGQSMSRITVLTGGMADTFTVDERSYAPCLGRWPNISLNVVGRAIPIVGAVAVEIAEFFLSVDIVLDTSDMASRGVGVHEYAHTAMCEIMRDASAVDQDIAWADLILHISDQSADNEQTYLVEGFADFLTSQVVGGMNYVDLPGSQFSRSIQYSVPGSASAETNLRDCPTCNDDDAFESQVGRVATLLHDAFDGPTMGPGYANDAVHWRLDGSLLRLDRTVDHRDDDDVELRGAQLFEVFDAWSQRGNTLRESSFLGGLGAVMKRSGYDQDTVCSVFEAHASDGSCPSYIRGLFWSWPIFVPPLQMTLR